MQLFIKTTAIVAALGTFDSAHSANLRASVAGDVGSVDKHAGLVVSVQSKRVNSFFTHVLFLYSH